MGACAATAGAITALESRSPSCGRIPCQWRKLRRTLPEGPQVSHHQQNMGRCRAGQERTAQALNGAALQQQCNSQRFKQQALDNCMASALAAPPSNRVNDLIMTKHLGSQICGISVFQPSAQPGHHPAASWSKKMSIDNVVGVASS